MNSNSTFNGLKIQSRVPVAAPESERWQQLTWAIGAWRKAALSHPTAICENAARELEIERDHGVIVHITPRV